MFKTFVLDVDDALTEDVVHFVNDDYNIVTEYNGEALVFSADNLNKYYQIYILGRRTYSQTVVRTAVAINKIINEFFNIDFS